MHGVALQLRQMPEAETNGQDAERRRTRESELMGHLFSYAVHAEAYQASH